jgi:hypothetical protein
MKASAFAVALMSSAAFLPIKAQGAEGQAPPPTISFAMVQSANTSTCRFRPSALVVDRSFGTVELLTVHVAGLPGNTDFDLFSLQVPHAKFGLAWYIGDIQTNRNGQGIGQFVGRFNKETFIVSLDKFPSPNIFRTPPQGHAVLPQEPTGVTVLPTQLYHLGLWFNSATDAARAGCPNTPTPFNGEHNAGIQILNTSNFPDLRGPLLQLQ